MSNLLQYVVVRSDLVSWPIGALIAQACHATAAVTHLYKEDEYMIKYLEDLNNMHKVVLGIDSEEAISNLSKLLSDESVDHKLWIEQPENIPTCLVTKPYPKDLVKKYFKALKLLKQPNKS